MFDVGWSELMVIGVVALIVIGPKDLPVMFQALGRFTAKARSMAREFSRAMEDAAKTSGMNDVAKDLKGLTSPKSLGLDKVQQAVGKFEAWDPMKKSAPTVKGTAAAKPAASAPTLGGTSAALATPVSAAPTVAGEAAQTVSAPAAGASAPVQGGAASASAPTATATAASAASPAAAAPVPVDPLAGT